MNPPALLAVTDTVGKIPAASPLLPNIDRLKYQNPQQRSRSPFYKKPPKKDKRELDDEHKVDDYA